jgi:translocation and assembly module TamA
MRGFAAHRLSPMWLQSRQTSSGSTVVQPVPLGGNGLFESSVELRYSLTPLLSLATFVDAGFVTDKSVELQWRYFSDNMLYAFGGGVRYRTPVGPVRLDLAYRPNIGPPLPVFQQIPDVNQPNTQAFNIPGQGCFGFGKTSANRAGSPEGTCSIHLSVGEAF